MPVEKTAEGVISEVLRDAIRIREYKFVNIEKERKILLRLPTSD